MEASKPESFEVKTQLGRVRVKSMGADNDLGGYCCSVGRRVDDVKVESRVGRVDDAKLESRRRTFDPSKLVEGYQVIGRGTFSTVYKASYDGQEVVVKIPLLTSQESKSVQDSLKRAFDQEVSMWSRLDHPNIVKFIGASDDLEILNNVFYMVAEYLPRGTLNSFLARKYRSKLSLKAVIQLALDLARGLEYLHSENIVHRDVKPENLLLDNYGKLKIADFGVSRLLNSEQGEMTGQMGTFGFMAPEVLEKKKDYDAKCDVYSFGICLWMIYCCDIPYDRSNFADASSAIVHKGLRPHIPKCCPKSLAKIMKSCWSANPEERPDMKEVVSLLENIDTSKGGGMIREDQAQCSCFPMTKTRLKFFHRRSVK